MSRKPSLVQYTLAPGQEVSLRMEDCVSGMGSLPEGSVNVVVTSPPYNLGIQYGTYDDTSSRREYLDWTIEWATAARRVLSDEGSFFLNLGGKPSDPWGPLEVLMELRRHGWALQNVIHWIKSIAIEEKANGNEEPEFLSRGHYKPINSPRFLNDCHEYIFHLTKCGDVPLERLAIGVPYQDKSNIGRWNAAKSDVRCRGNTWFIPYETIQSRANERPHPASFPVRLPEMCIRLHGLERTETVLDPFLGIGSTALAAVKLGKSVIGYEIDPEYFETACRRVAESTGRLLGS